MSLHRIAVIFDDRSRPETTGVYCRRALQSLVQVRHFLPSELSQIAPKDFDLYVFIDDGMDYPLPNDLHPSVWWAIDTHMDLPRCLRRAQGRDLVFAAQRDGTEALRQSGVAAQWLPLACDPEIHAKHDVAKQFDVCFVGNLVRGPREELVRLLQRHFPNHFVGQRYFQEMAQTYSASRIVFNRSVLNDINMRVFEALASGSLLLTNDLRANGQGELVRDGMHLATYGDADDLLDKARYYLSRESVRERVAAAGRQEALARHTYRHRMEKILEAAERLNRMPQDAGGPVAQPPSTTLRHDNQGSLDGQQLRDLSYYHFDRPEVVELVPRSAKRILDIGCGAGRLGETLKARQNAEVVGMELDPAAASLARDRLDRVVVGDIEQLVPDFANQSFDAVICGDVLEHLRDPGALLRRVHSWLRPEGCLVTSIPNIRHQSILRNLLLGNWTYEPAGLLDQTHLRFFTRREMEKLLFRAGFTIEERGAVPDGEYAAWERAGRPGTVNLGRVRIEGFPQNETAEFRIIQYLFRARPALRPNWGLTSIVVVVHNAIECTQQCLASVGQYTDEPYEVIVVDNGSTDATPVYLEHLSGIRTVRNLTNRGYPAAANQGIQAANGQQIVLLNNDCVVTTGWLYRMLSALYSAQEIGLVGPCTNVAPEGPQRVRADYDDLDALDGFAWDFGQRLDGQRADVTPLSGFCLVMKRALVERIGLLDERFGVGCLEDDDYCLRAKRAGFRVLLARDVYIHHFGHRTFQATGVNMDALYQQNLPMFQAKWDGQQTTQAPTQADFTSIILVTYNQLAYTPQCLESLRRHTPEAHEIIVVDNGSTDGTVEYLRAQTDIRCIELATNLGFPAAANLGIEAAQGDNLLLLNNDTVVTPDWLKRLLGVLHSDPRIGIVGPCSNHVSGEQEVPVNYEEDLTCLDEFARHFCRSRAGVTVDTDRLVGFCMLFRREVRNAIGLLDEQFGIGNFEDDDYCLRAMQAGYRLVIVGDAFVHHFGRRTFDGSGVDFAGLMKRNEQIFLAKWRRPDPVSGGPPASDKRANPGGPYTVAVDPAGGLLLVRRPFLLSVCIIARDNARIIEHCVRSVRDIADEVIVEDTGSKDETPEIAARLGARVFHFPWCDDFSAARNESFRHARGEWIFWLDTDDILDEDNGRQLRDLVRQKHPPNLFGFVVQVHWPTGIENGEEDMTVVDHVKLFRNRPSNRFEGRIHEQIVGPIRRCGGELAWTDLFVIHAHYDNSPEGQIRKKERDLRILHLEEKDHPNHPFNLFNLGMTYENIGEYDKAIGYLRRSLIYSDEMDSHVRKIYALLVQSEMQLNRLDEAVATCQEGSKRFPQDMELRFRTGILLHRMGRLAEAAEAYERIFRDPEERHFSSLDPGIGGHKARHNLAMVYADMSDFRRAEEQWRLILEEKHRYRPAWRGLGSTLVRQDKLDEAAELAGNEMVDKSLEGEGWLLQARLECVRGDHGAARRAFEQAIQLLPNDLEALRDYCAFLCERVDVRDAEPVLKRLLELNPADVAARQTLGRVYRLQGRHAESANAFCRALQDRPDSAELYFELGKTLQADGRTQEAVAAWEQALQLAPGHPEVTAALRQFKGAA
jgi:GT2 family glycosyltransferase/tetratricopeptide (TPR) repeat protein/2-polyprenyl-3-methyl-5-hydroxy-6-metoxy-1,4-benzoquinol methylase